MRLRKETAEFHRIQQTDDAGHNYIADRMELWKKILYGLGSTNRLTQGVKKIAPALIVVSHSNDEASQFAKAEEDIDMDDPAILRAHQKNPQEKIPLLTKLKPKKAPLTQEECKTQRDFMLLYFFFDFNRLRDTVRNVWSLYQQGRISVITAALVTDLAQSRIQQNVAAVVEDLEVPKGQLSGLIKDLHDKIVSGAFSRSKEPTPLSDAALRHIFCMESIGHLDAYFGKTSANTVAAQDGAETAQPFLLFLQFFTTIQQKNIKFPVWDAFREAMLVYRGSQRDWLPFGMQILLEIQDTSSEDFSRVFKNVAERGIDILSQIRRYVDYEDRMWDAGEEPDYMTKDAIKFSTVFIQPMERMLEWLGNLLNIESTASKSEIDSHMLYKMHSPLAGLALWHFQEQYHSTPINNLKWFINGVAHLYNAARHMGGLDLAWPDMDFMIDVHGTHRIFRGSLPTDPTDFYRRYLICASISSRYMASDYQRKGKFAPRASEVIQGKIGLMTKAPLEDMLEEAQRSKHEDKWVMHHKIFNYIHKKQKEDATPEASDDFAHDKNKLKDREVIFTKMVTQVAANRKKGKGRPRLPQPNFSKKEDEYPSLLRSMAAELKSHEVHSNFDYLSFYRRVYHMLFQVRDEAACTDASWAKLGRDPDANLHDIISRLFFDLQTKPKPNYAKITGQELSTDVVPLNLLGRIAERIASLIREHGSTELNRTKQRLSQDWDELTNSYATDGDYVRKLEPPIVPVPAPPPAPHSVVQIASPPGGRQPTVESDKEESREIEVSNGQRTGINKDSGQTSSNAPRHSHDCDRGSANATIDDAEIEQTYDTKDEAISNGKNDENLASDLPNSWASLNSAHCCGNDALHENQETEPDGYSRNTKDDLAKINHQHITVERRSEDAPEASNELLTRMACSQAIAPQTQSSNEDEVVKELGQASKHQTKIRLQQAQKVHEDKPMQDNHPFRNTKPERQFGNSVPKLTFDDQGKLIAINTKAVERIVRFLFNHLAQMPTLEVRRRIRRAALDRSRLRQAPTKVPVRTSRRLSPLRSLQHCGGNSCRVFKTYA